MRLDEHFIQHYEKEIEPSTTLPEFFKNQRREIEFYIGDNGNGNYYPLEKIASLLGISKEQLRKKLNGQKPLTRDWLIAICAAHGLDENQCCDALVIAELPQLDDAITRDQFFIIYLRKHCLDSILQKGAPFHLSSLIDLDNALEEANLSPLDIQRKDKKAPKKIQSRHNTSFKEYRNRAVRVFGSNGDPYDSLATEYLPDLLCVAAAFLETSSRQRLCLEAYSDGLFRKIEEDGATIEEYHSLDATGDYIVCFRELAELARKEKQRVDDLANDTRNYGKRFSANVRNDSLHVFLEEYNYSMPERNEYYFMEYSNGHYALSISHESLFMQAFLSDEEYRQHYSTRRRVAFKTYNSIAEIEKAIQSDNQPFFYPDLFKSRKAAFIRMQKEVSEKLELIRAKKIFIQNLHRIWDNEADVLHYYNIEKEFNCRHDGEYGELLIGKMFAEITDESGDIVTISFDDVCQAFELGFENIQQICRVKKATGSIRSVLK